MQQYLQSQFDQMKEKVEGANGELASTLLKIGTYDKTLNLMQARVNQSQKDIKTIKESLGEEIYNLDLKQQEQVKAIAESLILLKRDFDTQISEKEESYTNRLRD